MSRLTEDLISLLFDQKAPYRILHRLLSGYYESRDERMPSDAVLRTTLSRLKKNGLLDYRGGAWTSTPKGKNKVNNPLRVTTHSATFLSQKKRRSMIVMFDVPEVEKQKRIWLRAELRMLGFVMLQKSVWFGPSPLPQEFVRTLNSLELLPYLRFFAVKATEVV